MVKVMWFGVCLWATFGIPLRHTRARVHRSQPLVTCCGNRSSYSGSNCCHGIRNTHVYVHRLGRCFKSVFMQFAVKSTLCRRWFLDALCAGPQPAWDTREGDSGRGSNFLNMSNGFKLCPTHFSGRQKFLGGLRCPLSDPPSYGPVYVSNYLVECRMWDMKVNSSAAIKLIAQQLS